MLGSLLRHARKAQGLTLEAVADAVGVTHPHLSKIERGHAVPSLDLVVRLAELLKLQAAELGEALGGARRSDDPETADIQQVA